MYAKKCRSELCKNCWVRSPRKHQQIRTFTRLRRDVDITRTGSQASARGPAKWFSGSLRIDSPFQRNARRASAAQSSPSNQVSAREHDGRHCRPHHERHLCAGFAKEHMIELECVEVDFVACGHSSLSSVIGRSVTRLPVA